MGNANVRKYMTPHFLRHVENDDKQCVCCTVKSMLSGHNVQQTTPSGFEASTKTTSSATKVIRPQITSSPSDVVSLDNVTPASDTEQDGMYFRSIGKLLPNSWLTSSSAMAERPREA